MIKQRVLTGIALALVGLPIIIFGSWPYWLLIAALLGIAAWELARMFRQTGLHPAMTLMVSGVILLVFVHIWQPDKTLPFLTLWMLFVMIRHLGAYEKGRDQAATDFAASMGGIVYLGLLGIYLIDLRGLPDGLWWLLTVLPIVWAADSGAYAIGRRWGQHKLSPRLSPKKTWEGYLGGIVVGISVGGLLAWIYATTGKLALSVWQGALLGLLLSAITPLGDLAESLFKRQAGIKDSSHLFPGHGGAFDRIDSWLWAAFLGYLFIHSFLI